MTISIQRCRELLGQAAEGHTDEEVAALLESLESASGALWDTLQKAKRPPSETAPIMPLEMLNVTVPESYAPPENAPTVEAALGILDENPLESLRWIAYAHETGETE